MAVESSVHKSGVDLHSHSNASDGLLSPRELAGKAAKLGLEVLALTDHDTVAGVPEFIKAASGSGLHPIGGVEISLEHEGTFHLLGLNVKELSGIPSSLTKLQEYRSKRNNLILKKLQSLGYQISEQRLKEIAAGGQIGRPHFALALIEKNYFNSLDDVFIKLLAKGAAAYVKKKRLYPNEGIDMLRKAGWASVIAHPISLNLSRDRYPSFIESLLPSGLIGIEAYHPKHDEQWTNFFCKMADKYNLVITAGSDFHGDHKPGSPLAWVQNNSPIGKEVVGKLAAKLI